MLFLDKEKNNMEILFLEIQNSGNNNFIFIYNDHLILSVRVENYYETDNGEELDSENYEEYNAYVVSITEIIIDTDNHYSSKKLFELSYKNFPKEIKTIDGNVIFKSSN